MKRILIGTVRINRATGEVIDDEPQEWASRTCVRFECGGAKLIWMKEGESKQTDNGFLVAKIGARYCPKCAVSYGGESPIANNNASDEGNARWERSEYPHPKFQIAMRRMQLLPDVIWIRFHGEEVTGWQKSSPNSQTDKTH